MEKIYTLKEVAHLLQVNVITVRRWIQDEKLKAVKLGKEYRVKETDLKEFLEIK